MRSIDVVPLIGRDAEVSALERALGGPGGLVLLAGEAGIGKSALAREGARLAAAEARPVVWARPEQVTRPGPFALVVDLVENLAARASGADAEEADALADRLLSGAGEAPPRRVAAEIRGLLAHLGARPVAIFEDLHHADEASHAVIVHLARSAADDGRHLIATYRPEELGASEELERFLDVVTKERLAEELEVHPLDRAACEELATSILGGATASSQAEWIARTSEGVPFFVEELAAAYVRTGSMAGVPDTISRAVLARTQRLGPVARQVVSAAALMAGAIDAEVLAEACDLDQGTVARTLADAARAGIVEDRGERLLFRHALVREALTADLVSVEAQELHRRIAVAIERVRAGAIGQHAKALAHHWYQGRERDKAMRYALDAGERALALAATHDAQLAYELAIACVDGPAPPEALRGLAEVGIREGRTEDADDLLRRAADGLVAQERPDEAALALGRLAWVRTVSRRDDEAMAALDEALDLVGGDAHLAQRGKLLGQKGEMLTRAFRRYDEARELLRQAADIAARIGDHGIRAEALDALSWATYYGGDLDNAVINALEASAEAAVTGRAETIGRTHNNLALHLAYAGRLDEALRYLDRARAELEASFGTSGVAVIDLTEAIVRWRLGQPNQVARLVGRREVGWAHWRGYTRMLQTWAAVQTGDLQRAEDVLERFRAELGWNNGDGVARTMDEAYALICELFIALEREDREKLPVAQTLLELARGEQDDHLLATVLAARAALVAGDLAAAEAMLAEGREIEGRFSDATYATHHVELGGLVALARGDAERAAADLAAAAARFESMGNFADRARCIRQAAGLPGVPKEEAVSSLRLARELAMAAGAQLEVGRTEAALRERGIRPRAGRPRKGTESVGGLSAREEEVAALVGAGASNADIAARLYLSERTVQDHITHALRKLDLSGRAGLAAWAAKRGLV